VKSCQKCKSYKDCSGKTFYNYSDIRFCPYQVLWVIEQSEVLQGGNWPSNPDESSYIDPGIRTGYKDEAYYAKPVGILGEVNARLARAGTHGKLLRAEVLAELELSEESKSVLMYIKGWRRKGMSYKRWLKDRRYLGKKYDQSVV